MSLPPLTKWEVEEFIQQVECRGKLWIGKNLLWVRREQGINLFAVKFQNGLPRDMYAVSCTALNGTAPLLPERHTQWLLSTTTSFGERLRLEKYFTQVLPSLSREAVVELARGVCELWHASQSVSQSASQSAESVVSKPSEVVIPKPTAATTTSEPSTTGRKLSPFLRKLLGEKK